MLYKFKSPAAGDVIMLPIHAEQILAVIGKTPGAQGIITVAQIPDAITALRAADNVPTPTSQAKADDEQAEGGQQAESVGFRQRAEPFIHLLEVSLAEGKDVVWGV